MASRCSCRIINKSSITSLLNSAVKSNLRQSPSAARSANFSTPNVSTASPLRRFFLSRSPSELGGVQSLLPLHNAVAAARLTSCLSTSSRSCRSLSQGT